MRATSNRPDYTGYFEARGWDKDVSAENFWYYDELRQKVGIQAGAKVLDVGFGDGRFLDWCAHRDMVPTGIEIIEPALAKARALGHEVVRGPFNAGTFAAGKTFDLIACFDVIEHLTIDEFRALLADSLPHLAPSGRYLFRFPNGNSPFMGPVYNSDVTHLSLLTPGAIAALALPLELKIEAAFNDRILPPKGVQRVRRQLAFALRSVIETVVCLAYFGSRLPLDPNVFVVVGRMPPSVA